MISKAKKLQEHFMKKNCKGKAKMNSGLKNQSREKSMDCTSNGRTMITHSIAGLICTI